MKDDCSDCKDGIICDDCIESFKDPLEEMSKALCLLLSLMIILAVVSILWDCLNA